MPIETGARIGPYEISAKLGAGGMGEVWKARDPRLDRTVAIKVSAEKFSERFEREARAVAALNHPNICQIYDVGPDYIVLEYVEGSSVAPTDSIRKLLDLATQIADGMAAAHAAGFVHRDLKPANVLVTPDGRVKILDFGLVKTISKPSQSDATQALTLTDPGAVAGTAAYMSPEQASGSPNLDARSDQFSLGLMLYEMATGKQAFRRPTAVETLAAIIREDAEPLPPTVPPPLRWIINRCLAKEPRDRYESSRDLFLELRSLREHLSDTSPTVIPAAAIQPKRKKPWAILGAFAVGSVMAVLIGLLLRPAAPRASALHYTPFSFEQGGQANPVWSPDGKAVAFAARQKDPYQVYVRYLDSPTATQLTHLSDFALPVDWTSTGRIVFWSGRAPAGLWSVSPVGGDPEPFAAMSGDEAYSASVSHDGSAVAFFHAGNDGVSGLWISSPPGSAPRPYAPAPFASRSPVVNGPRVKFSPDGKQLLLIRNDGSGEEAWLMPYPADASHPPHRILEKFPAVGGTPSISWMPDNRHVVLSSTPEPGATWQLYLADTVSGEFSVLSGGTTAQTNPAVSPDGSKLVFLEFVADQDIVSMDLATAVVTPLIATQRSEQMPAWASKESAMVYVTDRNGQLEIWLHKPEQPDRPVVTARDFPPDTTQWFIGAALSPDASRVIYTRRERGGPAHLWMSAVAGGSPVLLVKGNADFEACGSWSPDGNWFVYWASHEGTTSLNKVKTTGEAEPEVLKADVKRSESWVPVWSPTGDWILHSDDGVKLISPDGKNAGNVSAPHLALCTFSANGAMLYCLRQEEGRQQLLSMNLDGKAERVIGPVDPEYAPSNQLSPSLRISLAPDGKSVAYSVLKTSSNLWLLDGLPTVK